VVRGLVWRESYLTAKADTRMGPPSGSSRVNARRRRDRTGEWSHAVYARGGDLSPLDKSTFENMGISLARSRYSTASVRDLFRLKGRCPSAGRVPPQTRQYP